ncbi:MAG: DNA methyltransferase [Eubacteriales bacterium]|nr:DNA methyltransferase [Eubacteriales bacterium]
MLNKEKQHNEMLERVSKEQIVFGRNYFDWHFPPGRIVWDKCNGKSSFSDCEIASCSLHDSIRLFRYMWNGMFQGKSINEGWIQQGNKRLNEKRIHPTQKPVNRYRWIASRYLRLGMMVLDTHVGSASSLIAYQEAGINYVGFEVDPRRFAAAANRLQERR